MARPHGAVACGHPVTAEAATEILQDGGNAYDAAIAAMCAAAVAEPVLCSLGGGGFMTAAPADGEPLVYDFFVQTPRRRPADAAAAGLDFYPIHADFGTATQEFHIGLGAMATPGAVGGLFALHRDLGSLPMTRLVEPAVRHARAGVALRAVDSYLFSVVGPILTARPDSRQAFTAEDGRLLTTGERVVQADLADLFEALAREGEALFYRGEVARSLAGACRDLGGLVGEADLESYEVIRRRPLQRDYRGVRVLTNPPPSTGGLLIAFKLSAMAAIAEEVAPFGAAARVAALGRVMALTNRARRDQHVDDGAGGLQDEAAAERFLSHELLQRYLETAERHAPATRGTTHISVIDRDGNLAALTMSNGEGCGYVLPGTGVMLNNMLGEEDLNAGGFHRWRPATRLASMMAPSIALLPDGSMLALGSGGSNRIRTAIFQVILNLIDHGMTPREAVDRPRLHVEAGIANAEEGLGEACRDALRLEADAPFADSVRDWPQHNLFFGGTHLAMRSADGRLSAAGDPRRGGVDSIA